MTIGQTLSGFPVAARARRAALSPVRGWHLFLTYLVVSDAIALATAFGLAYVIRFKTGVPLLETPPHSVAFYSGLVFWALPVWLGIFALYHLYDRQHVLNGFQEYTAVLNACTAGMMAIVVISFLDVTLYISRGWLLLVWALSMLLVASSRFVIRRVVRRLRARGYLVTPTVIVGANEEGRALAEQLLGDPGSGAEVVGFVDGKRVPGTPVVGGLTVLGSLGDLARIVRAGEATEIVVATTALTRDELLDLYRAYGHVDDVEIRLSSGLFEVLTTGVRVHEVSCIPMVTPQRVRITGVDALLKLSVDHLGAAIGLILLSPLLLLLAILVKLDSPGPVFHRRRVLGRHGRPFDALKFRTMVVNADAILASDPRLREAFQSGHKLREDPRVTRLGGLLRRTSLDELPQLVNVLRGEMSLVGPRMIAPDEAERYGKWQLNLLTVKPGITGPWQVHGRSDLPYDERVRLSMHYIRNYSIWLDLEILIRTVGVVLQGKGAY